MESRGPRGSTVLNAAIKCRSDDFRFIDNRNTECIRVLLKAGCNINAKDDNNKKTTPLLAASNKPHTNEIIKEFLLAGADIRPKGSNGLSVLESALRHRCGSHETYIYDSYVGNFIADITPYEDYRGTPQFEDSCKILVNLLYIAGVTVDKAEKVTASKPWLEIVRTDKDAELSLSYICRSHIRSYLLCPSGGNHVNLLVAIPKLPLPAKLKDFLLYYVNLTEVKDIEPPEEEGYLDEYMYFEKFGFPP